MMGSSSDLYFKKISLPREADLGASHKIFDLLKKRELPSPIGMQGMAENHPEGDKVGILVSGGGWNCRVRVLSQECGRTL